MPARSSCSGPWWPSPRNSGSRPEDTFRHLRPGAQVYARRMKHRLPGCAILLAAALTIFGCGSAPVSESVAAASSVPLVDTRWRLTNLGDRVIDNPPGPGAVSLQLQPQNLRLTGFAGCNRMF